MRVSLTKQLEGPSSSRESGAYSW